MTQYALVVGESLIDQVDRPGHDVALYPGGSPMNVAIGLARLGRRAHLATWFGQDDLGGLIAAHLRESGVHLEPGSDRAPHTSVAHATVDSAGVASYQFDLEWTLGPVELADGLLVAHTGSIATTLAPGGAQTEALLARARERATITYDPNMRPGIMGSPSDTWPVVRRYLELADVVKVSDEDLAWLTPGREVAEVAREWLTYGPAVVVVTRGGHGAVALTAAGDAVEVDTPPVTVADTVGAGDSFMAGLIDGLWQAGLVGATSRDALRVAPAPAIEAVLRRAARIAAITVSRPGANPPWSNELNDSAAR